MDAARMILLATFIFFSICTTSSSLSPLEKHIFDHAPPIVYTIAGSDSGGGAGIQADLHAIHAFGCHGCTAITCLTAQNSVGVTEVHIPPISFLRAQLDALLQDLPPVAIKIGMLGTEEIALEVGRFLKQVKEQSKNKVWIVLDPVMISTSGHHLMEQNASRVMVDAVFPYVDVLTPNKFEAETLLGHELKSVSDIQQGAKSLLKLGVGAVLIKGGHAQVSRNGETNAFAQDYLLSSRSSPDEPRLCDASRGIWFRSERFDTPHTHGTGCTLSSALAAALAIGERERGLHMKCGSLSSIDLVDACTLAKAYVSCGIRQGSALGQGPGPMSQTEFPCSAEHFPSIISCPSLDTSPFRTIWHEGPGQKFEGLGAIYPIVDSLESVARLCQVSGITDIQLRVKGERSEKYLSSLIYKCQALCEQANVRLWINDFWRAAVNAKCFGVHLGQEDLLRCAEDGGLDLLRGENIALGVSTHSFSELAVALGLKPSYISLGPIFETGSKTVSFDPQGVETISKWRELVPTRTPLVVIGGIGDSKTTKAVKMAGANSAAVIAAVSRADDTALAVAVLNAAMS